MLEDMKTKILHSLVMQMDTMQLNMKREEDKNTLVVFYPKCRKKHEKNEFPMDALEICGIDSDKHPTDMPFLISTKNCSSRRSYWGNWWTSIFYESKKTTTFQLFSVVSKSSALLCTFWRPILWHDRLGPYKTVSIIISTSIPMEEFPTTSRARSSLQVPSYTSIY